MKARWLVLALALSAFPVLVAAQGAYYQNIAFRYSSLSTTPAPGAMITVCTASSPGCPSLASIFTDAGLTNPQNNPFTADNFGNFGFYAASGTTYRIQVSGPTLQTYLLTWVAPLVSGGTATFGVINGPTTFTGNDSFSGTNTHSGTETFTGTQTVGKWNGNCVVDGVANTTLAAAVTCAGSSGVIEIPMFAVPTLTASVTIPVGVKLQFDGPSCINTTGFTLTINGDMQAGRYQVFCGTGTVAFSASTKISAIFPEWFGAKGDGTTDDRAAIQAAWNASVVGTSSFSPPYGTTKIPVVFGCSTYLVGSPGLNFSGVDNYNLQGCTDQQTKIQVNFTGANTVGVDFSGGSFDTMQRIQIQCGTSSANAPTVCVLQARTNNANASNAIVHRWSQVQIQGYSTWSYYNYRAEQVSCVDCNIAESGTSGTPLTISGVNTAGVTSPNVTFGGANSCTLFRFIGSGSVVASSATATGSKLIYLDEGSGVNIQSFWYEGFANEQGTHETVLADTAGATGTIFGVYLRIHGNSLDLTNSLVTMAGLALNWDVEGVSDPPGPGAALQFSFANFQNSNLRFLTNVTNCFVASGSASGSTITLDTGCTPTAPGAISIIAAPAADIIATLTSFRFNHTGTTTLSPQSTAGNFTLTVPAITGTLPVRIAQGTATMPNTALGAGACSTVTTVSAPNALTTDILAWTPSGVVGTGDRVLIMNYWLTSAAVNFMQCNPGSGSVTPNAMTVDWQVHR